MKEQDTFFEVGIDQERKKVIIKQDFDTTQHKIYFVMARSLTKVLGEDVMNYQIIFKNKKFKNVIAMAEACLKDSNTKLKQLIDPKPDTTYYKELDIEDIDYANNTIVFKKDTSFIDIIARLKNIPTAFHFKIKVGNYVYKNISEIAAIEFADPQKCPRGVLIGLTNDLIRNMFEEVQDDDEE